MVPFIDVVLVLLIIFMITAPILQIGIEVDVPKTKTVKELTEVRMVVTIDRAQRVYLNDKPVNIHDIGQADRGAIARPREANGVRAVRRNGAVWELGHGGGRAAASGHSEYQRGDATAERTRADRVNDGLRRSNSDGTRDATKRTAFVFAGVARGCWRSLADRLGGDGLAYAAIRGAGRAARLRWAWWATCRRFRCRMPEVATESRVVDESKGLYKAEPPKITPPPPWTRCRFRNSRKSSRRRSIVTRPSKVSREHTPPPPNAVPYGGGGTPAVPTRRSRWGGDDARRG